MSEESNCPHVAGDRVRALIGDVNRIPNPQPRQRPANFIRASLAKMIAAIQAGAFFPKGSKITAEPSGRGINQRRFRNKGNAGAFANRVAQRRAANRIAKESRRRNRRK